MQLLKVHLFLFMLICIAASAMSVNFQPAISSHHDGRPGCRGGRRPWPNNGNGGGNGGGNNNNNNGGDTNNGEQDGQTGQTE